MRTVAITLILLCALVGCAKESASQDDHLLTAGGGKDPSPVMTPAAQEAAVDGQVRETIVRMEAQSTHTLASPAPQQAPEVTHAYHAVIDTSTSQTFAKSIGGMLAELDPKERDALRYVFVAYNMGLAKKVIVLQQSGKIHQASDLNDDQIIQLAYGDLNGKTFPEVLSLGRALAHTE
jgi:predicted component of type VI protein secretion system